MQAGRVSPNGSIMSEKWEESDSRGKRDSLLPSDTSRRGRRRMKGKRSRASTLALHNGKWEHTV